MPRVAVKSVADARRRHPHEFALLHHLGGSNQDVDTEVSNSGICRLHWCHVGFTSAHAMWSKLDP
jgi:hypothetical protein